MARAIRSSIAVNTDTDRIRGCVRVLRVNYLYATPHEGDPFHVELGQEPPVRPDRLLRYHFVLLNSW
jgi:hypothetical protein